jgi:hypothetical protein
MPITIRKQQTQKTIKVAPPPPTARVQVPPEEITEAETPAPSAVPAQVQAPVVGKPAGSYTWAVIVALVAVLACIALIGLQAWELNFYYQPEPAFPRVPSVSGPVGK